MVFKLANASSPAASARVDGGLLRLTFVRPSVDFGDVKLLGWVGDETPWQIGSIFVVARRDLPEIMALPGKWLQANALIATDIRAEDGPDARALILTLADEGVPGCML